MSELDEWKGSASSSEGTSDNGGNREGYRPSYNRENNYGSRPAGRGDRPQRDDYERRQPRQEFRHSDFNGDSQPAGEGDVRSALDDFLK